MSTQGSGYNIAVLGRALDLLETLAAASEPLGVSELSRRMGTTKSATYRILVNLERRGYVNKHGITARYTLGSQLTALGLRARRDIDLVAIVHPYLDQLSASLGETANLGIRDHDGVLYIDIVESHHDLRMAARSGARDSLHSTALGKAILAFLPQSEIEQILSTPLQPKTSRTITDPEVLRSVLDETRRTGIAVERGENEQAASCVGVPIFGPGGDVIAAISVAGPEGRMAAAGADQISESLITVGKAVTSALSGSWPIADRHTRVEV